MSNPRAIVALDAPAAIGPYSHAKVAGDLVFASGNLGVDPQSGDLVGAGDVAEETRRALANLALILEAAGSSAAQVVKTTIYLADMNDFATVNRIYGEVFHQDPPARTTVEVSRLPKDARVEIDAIAVVR